MQTTLKVAGMHCNACKMLVQMGLEDGGFEDKIESVESGEDNQGQVVLNDMSEEELQKAKEIINSVGHYQVIEND